MSIQGRSAHLTHRGVLGAFIIAQRKEAGAASDLFKLAQRCQSLGQFEDRCLEAEKFYQSVASGQHQLIDGKLPPKYIQAKSDIRGAFKAGLDLNKIPSYHKMKIRKAEANKEQAEPTVVPERVTPAVPDGVIVVPSDAQPEVKVTENVIVLGADGKARIRSTRDARDARPDTSLEDALASGQVIDAKTNLIVPEELAAIIPLFEKLNEHKRQQLAARWLKDTRDALSQQGMRVKQRGAHRAAR